MRLIHEQFRGKKTLHFSFTYLKTDYFAYPHPPGIPPLRNSPQLEATPPPPDDGQVPELAAWLIDGFLIDILLKQNHQTRTADIRIASCTNNHARPLFQKVYSKASCRTNKARSFFQKVYLKASCRTNNNIVPESVLKTSYRINNARPLFQKVFSKNKLYHKQCQTRLRPLSQKVLSKTGFRTNNARPL